MRAGICGLFMAFTLLLAAQELAAPVSVPSATTGVVQPAMTLLEIIVAAVGLVISTVFIFLGKLRKDDATYQKMLQAFQIAVIKTYNEEVSVWKANNPGTPITPERAARFREIAINNAKEFAAGPVKDLILSYAGPALHAIVQKLVNKEKQGG